VTEEPASSSESESRTYGLQSGKVFPAANARSLLNPLRRLVQSPRRTVNAIGLGDAHRVLELGCGPGFFSPSIVDATRGSVVLMDLQAEMLAIARERVGSARASFVCGDGARLPFAPASFDAVFVATVLGEIPDRAGCLDDVRRILRDDGVLAIAETRRDSDFIPLAALRADVEPHGFVWRDKHGIGWQYVAGFRVASASR